LASLRFFLYPETRRNTKRYIYNGIVYGTGKTAREYPKVFSILLKIEDLQMQPEINLGFSGAVEAGTKPNKKSNAKINGFMIGQPAKDILLNYTMNFEIMTATSDHTAI